MQIGTLARVTVLQAGGVIQVRCLLGYSEGRESAHATDPAAGLT